VHLHPLSTGVKTIFLARKGTHTHASRADGKREKHKTRNNTIIKPTSTSLSVCTRTAKNQSSPLALPVVFSARLPPAAPRSTSANPLFFVGLVLLSKSLTADDDVADDDDDGVFYVSHHSRRRRRMSVTRAKETLRQLPSRVLYFTRCACVYLSARS
jgi:hypothetical protein